MAKRKLFVQKTPLGHLVVLTRDRWREIVRYKHPALDGHERDVRECVREPAMIRESVKDPTVHLYYRAVDRGYLCVAVGGSDLSQRFVITAYFTKDIKKGAELWKK